MLHSVSRVQHVARLSTLAALTIALIGCGGGGSDSASSSANQQPGTPSAPGANTAPTISGQPAAAVIAGSAYTFQPAAADANNDPLTFTIVNKPTWATFESATGRLSGIPTVQHVGTYPGIAISVSDGKASTSLPAFAIQVQSAGQANRPPTISGNPSGSITVGSAYSFIPTASDPDGQALTFSIQNRPSWATFTPATGRLAGTPAAADAGNFANIVISVSDGVATAALPAFSITVNQVATGSSTLTWTAPTTNTDGSTLTNLAGFRIQYGTSLSALTQTITIPNPGLTAYQVDGLFPSTWYFTMTAYASSGAESRPSNPTTTIIQ